MYKVFHNMLNAALNLQTPLHVEYKDDYRYETIKTYKEWLRQNGDLTHISNFNSYLNCILKHIIVFPEYCILTTCCSLCSLQCPF
jgi:hypothetical protein